MQEQDGSIRRIGPAHPDYRVQLQSVSVNPRMARVKGLFFVLFGVAMLGISWRQLVNEGYYYPVLVLFGPVMVLLGTLIAMRPRYSQRPRDDAERRRHVRTTFTLGMLGLAIGTIICFLFSI